jgi:NADH-quinone oxidoreductase subunit J
MENLLASIGQNMFAIFGLMAVGGAAYMVASKTAVHSVLAFLFAMLGIAGCFLSLNAEFLGIAQLLVYAGGIVVLFLFVVMLVEMSKFKEKGVFQTQAKYALPAVGLGVLVIAGAFRQALFGTPAAEALTLKPEIAVGIDVAKNNAQAVSRGLFADYLLPFEILSIILLVALVGAVVLAKTERV